MKKLVMLITMLLPVSVLANSGSFVNADGTKESAICIDAAKSSMNLKAISKKYQLSKRSIKRIACNGIMLSDFVAKHKSRKSGEKIKVFTFNKEVGNVETEFCIAAATSNDEFKAVLKKHRKDKLFAQRVTCNKLPIQDFANKYGNEKFSI